ncbi:carbon-nitrogen hydrolase family protein [Fimbriimonas ginsengisoli]|uniref:Putative amidohydrolase n=1 Tax=Fimbriimonas ginsengisoli Gsoil 348 TaxID=661478 RepID=A0A068NYE2_FIMGI|nr:carbon-nitrogen hydrolase family protein [Fimbriimonas ginsengisoli]AIE86904.1 putative amidohydrolase [Fimbriimonas ginsengisoli Gsoil 348]
MRIACVQCNVVFGDPIANATAGAARLKGLKGEGVDLAVFPEAFLTGYCVECQADADALAIAAGEAPHAALTVFRDACDANDILAVVGFAEQAEGHLHNSAVLFEPGKEPRIYRKSHLPDLGLDKYVRAGSELPVFDTRLGRIGILICFDLRAPEATRVLAMQGAEILLLPTNWPEGAETSADHISIARAAENRIFVATCNRVGEENGFRFIGRSKIIHPTGRVLASAGDAEATLIVDVDLAEARQKRTVNIPGKYEVDVFESRRPELYGELIKDV